MTSSSVTPGSEGRIYRQVYTIEGFRCAACAARLERILKRLPGIEVAVNFAAAQIVLSTDRPEIMPDAGTVCQLVEKAGFRAVPLSVKSGNRRDQIWQAEWRSVRADFLLALLCSLPVMIIMLLARYSPALHAAMPAIHWFLLGLVAVVQFWCGRSFYRHGWIALRNGAASMDVLVALGTSMAFSYSAVVIIFGLHAPVYLESSAMVITLVLLGRLLEMRARHKAGEGLQHLLQSQPQTAHVEKEGRLVDGPVSDLRGGEILVVRPGEAIPADGVVVDGASEVDESALSGESVPVLRQKGDKVFAATLNQYAALTIRVVATGQETAFARILRFVEEAQGSKAHVQRLADRVSAVFVPVIIGIALLCFIGTFLWSGVFSEALIRAVSVLVVACPCALGLATPAAVMVGTARGAEMGILFRDATSLERIQAITALAFDKTGTLTSGGPVLVGAVPVPPYSEEFLLGLTLLLEQRSEHPLAQSVRQAVSEACLINLAKEKNDKTAILAEGKLASLEAVPGLGLRAVLEDKDGQTYKACLGTEAFLKSENMARTPGPDFLQQFFQQQKQGRTVFLVAFEGEIIGFLAFEDQVRSEAPAILRWVRSRHIIPVMMTGDHENIAWNVARILGIEQVRAQILPEQKVAEIQKLQKEGYFVGMVGDGINDAPALRLADIGIAMGSGAAMALETADVVLMKDGLSTLREAFLLSGATLRRIYQNLFLAFLYNIICVPFAAFGLLTPVLASAMMALSSVAVLGNALLLRWWKSPPLT